MYLWLGLAVLLTAFFVWQQRSQAPVMTTSSPLSPEFPVPTRATIIDGYYNFASEKTKAAYTNLCRTCKPYGNVSDVYYWWKYLPFYWQKQYQHCSKYGCGGSHDKSNCPQKTAFKPLDCSSVEHAPYDSRGYGATDALFYQNRAAFCGKNPAHISCPNSFSGQCPKSKEPYSTTEF